MKICFVVNECNFFYSHRFELAKKLTNLGEVFLITDCEDTEQKIIKDISEAKIKIHPIQKRLSRKGVQGFIFYFFSLIGAINHIKPSTIFFVTLEISFIGVFISWFKRKINCFYLITGFGPFLYKKSLKHRFLYFLHKIAFLTIRKNPNSKFIFQNIEDKNIFIKDGFASRENSILIHGSGINMNKIHFNKRGGIKSISFLFASRLVNAKGVGEFIQAGREIKNIFPNVNISVAGKYDSNDPDSISEKLFLEIQDSSNINYLGEISIDAMQESFLNYDIFVLPSHGEGLPKAAIEAAASGMPLILSSVSGCKECLNNNENGLLIEKKNVESIKSAMEWMILNQSEIPKMSAASRKFIEEKFSIEKIFNSYKKLLILK